ncbi:prepilin-type N-terminal cleavage/methylation domain-containing protein [Halomonas sp. NyZ770]|uniref:type IV pilus modification PilV family protein n=1 Tax=Halomonadaceae TaxID=28256 RepID=UPI001D0A7517|nr:MULTISPECIES: prepilin-type N-terminal cleavage/methylation domain-containing protein [Halomonas]UDM07762.1 prepilin-type N-terminal cleavage/methylation domain-containing protein [Halomonas sp. NyZ770]
MAKGCLLPAGKHRQQGGFSLVEALVALVVLSLGLISIAAMQLKALQAVQRGYQQTLVSVAALDAQERVWAATRHAEGCQDIPLAEIERAWHAAWFAASGGPLIRHARAADSTITRQDCLFEVTVGLDSALDASAQSLVYPFQLPL